MYRIRMSELIGQRCDCLYGYWNTDWPNVSAVSHASPQLCCLSLIAAGRTKEPFYGSSKLEAAETKCQTELVCLEHLDASENQSVWNTGEISLPIMGHHVHLRLSKSLLSEAFSSCFHPRLIIQALEKNSPAYSLKTWSLTSESTTRPDTLLTNPCVVAFIVWPGTAPKTCCNTNVYCYRQRANLSVPWFLTPSSLYVFNLPIKGFERK